LRQVQGSEECCVILVGPNAKHLNNDQYQFKLEKEERKMSNEKKDEQIFKSAYAMIEKLKPQLSLALPKHLTAERLARISLTELRQNPKLQECTQDSFMKCLMITAQLGLEPGLLGHVYFVPYGKEANIIIGYKGMLDLARRSGQIESVEARVVCAADKCEVRYGLESTIEHSIDLFLADRGKPIGYYAVVKFKDGGKQFEFMNVHEIEKIRNQSKCGKFGPWVTHFDEMAKKTVIRRLFKYLPVSVEMQKASNLDELGEVGLQKNVIDAEFFEVNAKENESPSAMQKSQSDELAESLK
jgi:recombination protein RecT